MKKELDLVHEFHKKFHQPILPTPDIARSDRIENRYELMKSEVEEYLLGAKEGDIENVAKELADILYAVYGTILEHGLQDHIEDIFEEVHCSNMSKDFHEYKMIKGDSYFKADVKKYLGR